ncbi:xanthine dehydrogenase [Monocercomonoides exilis]|uniref:xanthine dehydrogenase n=1 Tax=Monocercomonoides exilis TaxID=2049356 RepID=UPI003559CC47|nr:xanthine dehydrogenase [Monocercomonoides exilis]|eukprot:MONOS_4180.1-p1 / transcript=MONOS_4180.1 / gene=MONOS_4180 / organism=Monocercomonoides_exilis_PA203 / gene_product=xanthine dehydrogenase[EC:1.17.1.4] / transcript_product=xanthine dehydrogenase[EC:1.17.1.4] / location=Mono_scaffold00107:87440-92019(-) / protein_length=1494 / sequence_SO=supercontig / SO=protein_coding / is_pseudo=false
MTSEILKFYLNGEKVELKSFEPNMTLLQYLRAPKVGLTGTKESCGSGVCGACTILMMYFDEKINKPYITAVKSCQLPLIYCNGCAIYTIEGKNTALKQKLTPIQESFIKHDGAQCGFCLPGTIMSTTALFEKHQLEGLRPPTVGDIEETLSGHTCRCTGYRPIFQSLKEFLIEEGSKPPQLEIPKFPSELIEANKQSLHVNGNLWNFFKPKSLDEFRSLWKLHPEASILGGATNSNQIFRDHLTKRTIISTKSITEIQELEEKDGMLHIGAGVSVQALLEYTRSRLTEAPNNHSTFRVISKILPRLRSKQIRSVSTVAGEMMSVSEFSALLVSLGAVLHLESASGQVSHRIPLRDKCARCEREAQKAAATHPASLHARPVFAYDTTSCCVIACDEVGCQLITGISLPLYCEESEEVKQFADCVLVSRRKDNFPALMMVVMTATLQRIKKEKADESAASVWKFKEVSLALADGRGNGDRETTESFPSALKPKEKNEEYPPPIVVIDENVEDDDEEPASPSSSSPFSSASASASSPTESTHAALKAMKNSKRPFCIVHKLPSTAEFILTRSPVLSSETIIDAKQVMRREVEEILLTGISSDDSTDTVYSEVCSRLPSSCPPLPSTWLAKRYITVAAPDALTRFAYNLSQHLETKINTIVPEPLDLSSDYPLDAYDPISRMYSETSSEKPLELEPEQTRFTHNLQKYSFDYEKVDTLIGKPMSNMHLQSHATGMTQYTVDVPLPPRGLYAEFILSTVAHGKIIRIDGTEALKLPGVVDIVTAKDIPGVNKHTGIVMDTTIFADEVVECMHQPIGLILADTPQIAEYAATLVKVEYDELPAILTLEEAVEKKSFLSMYEGSDIVLGEPLKVIKETRKAQEKLAEKMKKGVPEPMENDEWVVIEGEAKAGGQDHYYGETQNCVVIPHDGMVDVYSSTQNPSKVQFDVAGALGIPRAKVMCKAMRLGGGFGGKQDRPCILATAAAVAAKKTGRAVRLVMKRSMDMAVHGGRHPMWCRYTVVASKKTGLLKALDAEVIAQGGYAHDVTGPVLFKCAFQLQGTYTIPNIRVIARAAKTNHNPNTAFRGFGAPQSCLFIEMIMEHVADVLGIPQSQIRDINLNKVGDPLVTGSLISQNKGEKFIRIMWDELMKTSDYENRLKAVEEFNATHTNTKRGIAITPMKNGACFEDDFMNQAEALVHVLPDGSVEVAHSGIEMGQGLNTKIAQVAAETLGIDISFIHVLHTSTETCTNTQPTAASTGLDLNGGALKKACEQINASLAPLREKMKDKTWPEICTTAYFSRYAMSGQAHFILPTINWQWKTKTGFTAFYYAFGVSVSEVEVDCTTGEYTILRSDLIEDAGRSLNPILDAGQVEGGFIQGVGWVTGEEIEYDIATGAMLSDMHTYAVPLARDVPLELHTTLAHGFRCDENVGASKTTAESPVLLGVSVLMALRHAVNAARRDRGLSLLRYQISPFTVDRIKLAIEGVLDGEDGMRYTIMI